MNSILDTLFLRKPRIEYVSPPVCEAQFSSSGSPIIVIPDIAKLTGPTGGKSGGRGNFFLSWSYFPTQICFSIYVAADPANPNSPYNLVSECIPSGYISLCTAGWYRISAILSNGQETAKSSPIQITSRENIALPVYPQAVAYNLYRSTASVDGPYALYWYGFSGNSFEVCVPGCYRVSVITPNGETPLSDAICTMPCSQLPCPPLTGWNPVLCECVPCSLINNPCPEGYEWDSAACQCLPNSGGGGDIVEILGPTDTGCVGQAYTSDVVVVGGEAPFGWSLEDGALPDGLTIDTASDTNSAAITGTPTTAGTFSFTVQVTDSVGAWDINSFTITISGDCCNATTDWTAPGNCRLRIQDYVDGLLSGNQCGAGFFLSGSGLVWDGTFSVFVNSNPTFAPDSSFTQVSGLSMVSGAYPSVLFYDGTQWVLQIACNKTAGGAGNYWAGSLAGSSPIGTYTQFGGCATGPNTLNVEAYSL